MKKYKARELPPKFSNVIIEWFMRINNAKHIDMSERTIVEWIEWCNKPPETILSDEVKEELFPYIFGAEEWHNII